MKTVLLLSIVLASCASSGHSGSERVYRDGCARGIIYIVGNEPFTHPALEYAGSCGGGADSVTFSVREMLTIVADSTIMPLVMNHQGKIVELYFDYLSIDHGTTSIHVTKADVESK